MDWTHIAEQSLASAPGVVILAGMFAKAIVELRRADARHEKTFARLGRRIDRICERLGIEEVTGRHSTVPPEGTP